jgi:serine hydrolase
VSLLFVHGGGDDAYAWDKKIADRLQKLIDAPLDCPHFTSLEKLEWSAVENDLGDALRKLPAGSIVVAHSVGASAVLKLLVESADPKLAHLFLLAPPYNGADGEWGDGDFAFPADFAKHLPPKLPVTIWHSNDDEVIPVENAHRYASKMPNAKVVIVDGYGHQFTGDLAFLARAIRGAKT